MAHEIDFSKGRPAIAYKGDKPWHGFGRLMSEDENLDEWKVAAGLDWTVEPRQVLYKPDPTSNPFIVKPYEPRRVLVRSDTLEPLSCVSDRFKLDGIQPGEIVQFFKTLIEKNGFEMETAGALRGGRRVWALARVGKDFVIKGDKVDGYLLLATAYDATFSTTVDLTTTRVVCNNTLGMALDRPGAHCIKIPHTQDFNQFDIKAQLGLDDAWVNFRDNVLRLSEHKVTKREAIEFFLHACGTDEEEIKVTGKQLSNVKKLLSIYDTGPGAQLVTAKDTLWGAVNAVTFLTDHARRAKDNGTRFDSASFGSGAAMKKRAFNRALEIAEAA
jgi:phage/plasmid-like protein (TIGR03299 family)